MNVDFQDLDSSFRQRVKTKKRKTNRQRGEKYYEKFFSLMSDMVFIISRNGIILQTNPAVSQILGYNEKELLNKNILEFYPREYQSRVQTYLNAFLRGKLDSYILPLHNKNKTNIPVESKLWLGKWKGEECVFNLSNLISLELESGDCFKRIFQFNPVLMAISLQPDHRFIEINDAFTKILGYKKSEIIGYTLAELKLFADPEQEEFIFKSLESSGYVRHSEVKIICKDGTVREELFSGEVIQTQGRKYFLSVMIDITKRKKSEKIFSDLNRCFLSLQADPRRNIDLLVESAGCILGGVCMIYNRFQKNRGTICTWAIWHSPENYPREIKPEGHICYDVIRKNGYAPVVLEDISGTKYEKTDPNVKKYGLKSFLGFPVRLRGETVGSFCLCDNKPRSFTEDEIKIIGLLARAVEIEEERLWTRNAIELAKNEWEITFDSMPDLIAILDKDYRIIRANRAMADCLGIHITKLPGKVCYQVFHGTDQPPPFCPHRRLIRDGLEHHVETHLEVPDRDFLVTASPLRDQNGILIGSVHVARDITRLKEVEESLQESKERMHLALSGANLGLCGHDVLTGEYTHSPQWVEMLGYTKEDVEQGKITWENLLHPADFLPTLKKLNDHLVGKTSSYEAEFRMMTRSGEWKWIQSVGRVFDRDEGGKPVRMIGTHRDITEQKHTKVELERHRNHLKEMISERNEELDALAGAMESWEERMTDLKKVINQLSNQLKESESLPIADDPLLQREN